MAETVLTIEIAGDSSSARKAIDEVASSLERTGAAVQGFNQQAAGGAQAVNTMGAAAARAGPSLGQTASAVSNVSTGAIQMGHAFGVATPQIDGTIRGLNGLVSEAAQANSIMRATGGGLLGATSAAFGLGGAALTAGFAIGALADHFLNAGSRAREAAAAVEQANQRISNTLGLTTGQWRAWQDAAVAAGVKVSTLPGIFDRLEVAIAKNDPALMRLAGSLKDAEGNSRAASDVFEAAVVALTAMADPAQQAAAAHAAFGGSAQEVLAIVRNYSMSTVTEQNQAAGQSARAAAGDFAALAAAMAQGAQSGVIGGFVGSTGGGANFYNRLGGSRADGGPVSAGRPYIVGDGGVPELFVPESNGYVLPRVPSVAPASGGGSVTVVVNAPNYVGDKRDFARVIREEIVSMQRSGFLAR